MNQRIINSLTNCFSCKRVSFYSNIILIGYFCLQIFEINQIYNPIRNQYQRTLNNILILKIRSNAKSSYFYIASRKQPLRISVK